MADQAHTSTQRDTVTRSPGRSLQECGPCAARACSLAEERGKLNFFWEISPYLNDGNYLKKKKLYIRYQKGHKSEVYSAQGPPVFKLGFRASDLECTARLKVWMCDLTPLSLSFSVCKMGIINRGTS